MSIIRSLIQGAPLPRIVRARQRYLTTEIPDVAAAVNEQFTRPGVGDSVRPGIRIAVTAGSRGIARGDEILMAIVAELKQRGALPFIVPAMGSHGGATAEGQRKVLEELNITESTAGCPIVSSMEVVELGALPNGLPVYMDRHAFEADGIVVVNRVKPHPAFRGPLESGMVKMITIGLGKQKGAESCHAYGIDDMPRHMLEMASISLNKAKILFGVGIVENPYDKLLVIEAVPAAEIIERDKQLLIQAKANMPRIMFDPMDVLIIDRIGKEIAGTGMDPSIIGRYSNPTMTGGPKIRKIAVLDLTDTTRGNANGIGLADFTTRRLFNRIDFDKTYANSITNTSVMPVKLPMILETELDAVQAAIKTSNARDLAVVRLVRILDTLHLDEFWISEALMGEARANPAVTVCGELEPMRFSEAGKCLN